MIAPTPLRPAPDPEPERPEDEQFRGSLQVRIGTATRTVPTLKRVHSRDWKQSVVGRLAAIDIPDVDEVEMLKAAAVLTDDIIFELVLDYDRSAALGGREWLDENADDRDIHEAFELMLKASSPKADDPVAGFANQVGVFLALAWTRLGTARAERSASERSIAGSPGPTDGLPTKSSGGSRMSSSSSSGRTAKSMKPRQRRTGST